MISIALNYQKKKKPPLLFSFFQSLFKEGRKAKLDLHGYERLTALKVESGEKSWLLLQLFGSGTSTNLCPYLVLTCRARPFPISQGLVLPLFYFFFCSAMLNAAGEQLRWLLLVEGWLLQQMSTAASLHAPQLDMDIAGYAYTSQRGGQNKFGD